MANSQDREEGLADIDTDSLRRKLAKIVELESANHLLGVSFAMRDNAAVPSHEVVDYVEGIVRASIELFADYRDIPILDDC